MHPAFLPSRDGRPKCDTSFHAHIYNKGCLVLGEDEKKSSVSFYVGAVNPYATYEIDIHSWEYGNDGNLRSDLNWRGWGCKTAYSFLLSGLPERRNIFKDI